MVKDVRTHGIWWNIAGAGWISALPEHHDQTEMFGGCLKNSRQHTPFWGGEPLLFTKEEAEKLAASWSNRGWGSYEARLIHEESAE
jgi:hypothetical protein